VPLCALDGRGVEKVTMGLRLLIQNLRAADEDLNQPEIPFTEVLSANATAYSKNAERE